MKKSTVIYILVALVVILGGIAVYAYLTKDDGKNGSSKDNGSVNDLPTDGDEEEPNYGEYRLSRFYIGDGTWGYSVSGQMPNPCYEGEVDVVVKESFPEQVVVILKVIPPASDVVCAQVIKEYKYEGEISASEDAEFELVINSEVQ